MIARWIRKLGVWGWILITVGGFALIVVMAIVGFFHWQNDRIETMLARIRAAGEPVTHAESVAMTPAIAPERDATRFWIAGFRHNRPGDQVRFGKLPFVGAEKPAVPPLPGPDWPELALAEEYLADHAEALKQFHEAAELGGAARLDAVHDPLTFDLLGMREATQLLLVESLVQAHKGQLDSTVDSLETILSLGKACAGSPSLMSFVVRQAVDMSAVDLLLRLLPEASFSDAQLARLQSPLRAIDHRAEFLHALIGERVFGIRTLGSPQPAVGPPTSALEAFTTAFTSKDTMLRYLETMSSAISAAKRPWREAFEKSETIDDWDKAIPYYAHFEGVGTISIEWHFGVATRVMARIRMADIALALQRYRLANGRLPKTLDDLIPDLLPAVPLDPFTDEPLHYRPTDDGFVVYSVGDDREDDGGQFEEFRTLKPDLGYRIRYPVDTPDAAIE